MQNVFLKGRVLLAAAVVAAISAGGFLRFAAAEDKPGDTVVATVNGQPITNRICASPKTSSVARSPTCRPK